MFNDTSYYKEIQFFQNFLFHLRIPFSIRKLDELYHEAGDFGLRESLGITVHTLEEKDFNLKNELKHNTIFYLTDEFFSRYIFFLLPETEESLVMLIGPFLTEVTQSQALELMREKSVDAHWLPVLKNYFRKLTCLTNEKGLVAAIQCVGDFLWGANNYQKEMVIRALPDTYTPLAIPPDPQKRLEAYTHIEEFENMYTEENRMMQAIAQGQTNKAKEIFANFPLFAIEQRTSVTRNLKNYTIIMNTLFRKGAEQGGVHPIYIDQLSSEFAHRIEEATRSDNFIDLWNEMVVKYCALVNRHSIKKYSLPIQKIITRIDFDIAADLSLKANADYLNVNPSYLSSLFKKETGYNLTDYVNQKRMEHAAYLLVNSRQPVSAIAQSCGILDDNYFTKLFKRYYDKTPTQFRQDFTSNVAIHTKLIK